MEIKILRLWPKANYIIGRMLIDGEFYCNTLEPPETLPNPPVKGREQKYGKGCCIPEGTYSVEMYPSKHFGMRPLVKDVSGRSGILIHEGNTVVDTKGCILVGHNKQVGKVLDSRNTLRDLIAKIKSSKTVTLSVTSA